MLHNLRQFFLNKNDIKGVTLVEVVITTAILGFLMSMTWSASSVRNNDFIVMIHQEKLRALISRAKSMTINSVDMAGNCGYGVRIEQHQAFIFLNRGACGTNNDRRYSAGERISGSANFVRPREGIVFIPPDTGVDIVFIPPHPHTVINGNDNIENTLIRIESPAGIRRTIRIDRQGLINLEN